MEQFEYYNVCEKLLLLLGYEWINNHETNYDIIEKGDVVLRGDGKMYVAGKQKVKSYKLGFLLAYDGTKVYRKKKVS